MYGTILVKLGKNFLKPCSNYDKLPYNGMFIFSKFLEVLKALTNNVRIVKLVEENYFVLKF